MARVLGGSSGGGGWGSFRAAGGASLRLTPLAADLRHRAATHVLLFAACLDAGAVDQAGVCLRQLCAPLSCSNKGSNCALPAASADPAARAVAVRAVGCGGGRVDQTRLVVERGGSPPGSENAPGAARQGGRGGARGARRRGGSRAGRTPPPPPPFASSSSLEDGESGRVAAARTGRWWRRRRRRRRGCTRRWCRAARARGRRRRAGALLRAGAVSRRGGRRRRPPKRNDDARVDDERYSAGCWRSRLFAQRALAALLAPGRPTSRRRARPGAYTRRSATPWRCGRSARGRMRERAGDPPRSRGAFFAPRGDGAGGGRAAVRAGRRARAQAQAGDRRRGRRTTGRRRSDATRASRRNRGGVRPARPGGLAGWMRFSASAPGSLASREEGEFRVSAGALVSRQMRAYGVGAWGCAMACAARLPRARGRRTTSSAFSRATRTTTTGGVGADLRAARHALASCAAGTVRWLVDLIARLPAGEVPGSIPRGVERIVAEGPVLAATAPHPCPARSPRGGLDRYDRYEPPPPPPPTRSARGSRRCSTATGARGGLRAGDCRRRRQALRRRPRRLRRQPPPRLPASAVVTPSGRRDFAAATAGLIEGVLDDDDGGAVAHLAAALVEPDVPALAAAQFFASELLPRFLARELRGTSQRRCARIWLTAIALLERLAREPDPDRSRSRSRRRLGRSRRRLSAFGPS